MADYSVTNSIVIMDLDETHLFVDEAIIDFLQEKLDDLHEKSYQFKKVRIEL